MNNVLTLQCSRSMNVQNKMTSSCHTVVRSVGYTVNVTSSILFYVHRVICFIFYNSLHHQSSNRAVSEFHKKMDHTKITLVDYSFGSSDNDEEIVTFNIDNIDQLEGAAAGTSAFSHYSTINKKRDADKPNLMTTDENRYNVNGAVENENVASETFEADRIIKHETKGKAAKKTVRYLVRWVGYGPEADTWEPLESFDSCPQVLEEYWTALAKPASNPIEDKRHVSSSKGAIPKRVCMICQGSSDDVWRMGHWVVDQTGARMLHFNCMKYSPIANRRARYQSTGMCGYTMKDVNDESIRAAKLVSKIIYLTTTYVCSSQTPMSVPSDT